MSLSLYKFREIVFQLLFASHFAPSEEQELVSFMMQQLCVTKKVIKEALQKKQAILSKIEELDALISRFSLSYDFDRIPQVEKTVLRLALYELCSDASLPPKVVISEAIRLTRKFATAESAGFVNAVLDAVYQAQMVPDLQEEKDDLIAPLSTQ